MEVPTHSSSSFSRRLSYFVQPMQSASSVAVSRPAPERIAVASPSWAAPPWGAASDVAVSRRLPAQRPTSRPRLRWPRPAIGFHATRRSPSLPSSSPSIVPRRGSESHFVANGVPRGSCNCETSLCVEVGTETNRSSTPRPRLCGGEVKPAHRCLLLESHPSFLPSALAFHPNLNYKTLYPADCPGRLPIRDLRS